MKKNTYLRDSTSVSMHKYTRFNMNFKFVTSYMWIKKE